MPFPDNRHYLKTQSAMEYLMTYGWAILVIAIVLGVLYYLGVFNSAAGLGNSCIAQTGYVCSNLVLSTAGTANAILGQLSNYPITITAIACTNSSAAPTNTVPISGTTLQTGTQVQLSFQCPGAAGPIGKQYAGHLWIVYNTATQSGQVSQIATFSAHVVTAQSSIQQTCYQLTLSTSGTGTLSANTPESSGCSSGEYVSGQLLTLTATAGSGYTFNSWSGSFSCSNSQTTCSVTMPSTSASETAAFSVTPPTCYQLTLSTSGTGTLSANTPESSGCSSGEYVSGQLLTLTATAGSGYTFNSWSGSFSCSNSQTTCSVTMPSGSASETATFTSTSVQCTDTIYTNYTLANIPNTATISYTLYGGGGGGGGGYIPGVGSNGAETTGNYVFFAGNTITIYVGGGGGGGGGGDNSCGGAGGSGWYGGGGGSGDANGEAGGYGGGGGSTAILNQGAVIPNGYASGGEGGWCSNYGQYGGGGGSNTGGTGGDGGTSGSLGLGGNGYGGSNPSYGGSGLSGGVGSSCSNGGGGGGGGYGGGGGGGGQSSNGGDGGSSGASGATGANGGGDGGVGGSTGTGGASGNGACGTTAGTPGGGGAGGSAILSWTSTWGSCRISSI